MDFSQPLTLANNRARLRPLAAADYEPLKSVAFDPEVWRYTLTRGDDALSLADYLAAALAGREAGLRYPFVVQDLETGQLAGSTSYYHVSPEHRSLSIGYTWLGSAFQRTGLNRAAKHLLLRHAFDVLGCERVELETDARNEQSQTAMRRLGATEEGTLRSHRVTQGGRRRDTILFSILRPEWEQLRRTVFAAYEA